MPKHSTISDVAEAISGLCYMDLRSIGEALAAMCTDGDVRLPPSSPKDFSDILCDWAETVGH